MKFLKKIGKALFGSSKPKKAAKPSKKAPKKKPAKPAKKKTVKKKTAPKKTGVMVKEALAALPVAEVTHYFPHVDVAVLKIKTGTIRVGDKLHFKGHTTNFTQKVASMQIDHKPVLIAKKGDDFGVQVKSRVRAGDLVTKI
jgi:putative protease